MEILLYACLFLVGIYLLSIKLRRTQNGRTLPGPKGRPVVGSALDVKPETIHETFYKYAKQFGDIFQVKVWNSTMVCINDAELVRKAFSGDPYKRYLNDRDYFFFADYIHYGAQTTGGYAVGNDPVHSGMRKGFTKAFHVYGDGVESFEEQVASEISRFVGDIDAFQGKKFNFEPLVKRSLDNLMSILMIGEGIADEDADMFSRYNRSTDFLVSPAVNVILSTFPFLRFVPGAYKKYFDDVVAARNAIKKKYVDDVLATYKAGTTRGIIDSLYSQLLADEAAGRESIYTYERIVCASMDVVGAGTSTSLATLSNLMVCLLHHPNYQKIVQEQLDAVVGRDRLPTIADRPRCPWLEAVLMETMRLIPTLPMLAPHMAREDIVFEGYHIPKKSTILANLWYIQHDEKVWGDPWTFRPERFLDGEGQLLPRDHALRKNWFPFGVGRRQCIGEQMARSRMFLYVATLLQRWTFVPIAGEVGPFDPRDSDSFETLLLIRPKTFHCRVEERN